jgi:hypothetical protein
MSTRYHIYMGDDNDGPVDYTDPVGDSADPWLDVGPRPAPSATNYGIRAYDDATGLEEPNVNVVVRLAIDATGRNVSVVPAPPVGVVAEPVGVSGALVRWVFLPDPARPAPDGFNVYANPGPSVDYAAGPALAVLHVAGARDYRATLAGLTGGVSYSIGVRATIGAAEEQNATRATVIPRGTPPLPVSDLTVTATYRE